MRHFPEFSINTMNTMCADFLFKRNSLYTTLSTCIKTLQRGELSAEEFPGSCGRALGYSAAPQDLQSNRGREISCVLNLKPPTPWDQFLHFTSLLSFLSKAHSSAHHDTTYRVCRLASNG